MYQIRLIAPKGASDFPKNELIALVELLFNPKESIITVDTKDAQKTKGHTITYIDVSRKNQKGQMS